jgi:hypothetical protein
LKQKDDLTGFFFVRFSNLSLDIYSELKFPDYGLNPLIDKNIHTLEKIRMMYAKCNTVRNNISVRITLNMKMMSVDYSISL